MVDLAEPEPFALEGPVVFEPRYFPERLNVRKQHELDRTSGFCKGEDVTRKNVKNREFHINGRMLGDDKNDLDNVIDSEGVFQMVGALGSYEVYVKEADYELVGHGDGGRLLWEYTLDLVSTGRDEPHEQTDGVVSRG